MMLFGELLIYGDAAWDAFDRREMSEAESIMLDQNFGSPLKDDAKEQENNYRSPRSPMNFPIHSNSGAYDGDLL